MESRAFPRRKRKQPIRPILRPGKSLPAECTSTDQSLGNLCGSSGYGHPWVSYGPEHTQYCSLFESGAAPAFALGSLCPACRTHALGVRLAVSRFSSTQPTHSSADRKTKRLKRPKICFGFPLPIRGRSLSVALLTHVTEVEINATIAA